MKMMIMMMMMMMMIMIMIMIMIMMMMMLKPPEYIKSFCYNSITRYLHQIKTSAADNVTGTQKGAYFRADTRTKSLEKLQVGLACS